MYLIFSGIPNIRKFVFSNFGLTPGQFIVHLEEVAQNNLHHQYEQYRISGSGERRSCVSSISAKSTGQPVTNAG